MRMTHSDSAGIFTGACMSGNRSALRTKKPGHMGRAFRVPDAASRQNLKPRPSPGGRVVKIEFARVMRSGLPAVAAHSRQKTLNELGARLLELEDRTYNPASLSGHWRVEMLLLWSGRNRQTLASSSIGHRIDSGRGDVTAS